MLCLVELIKALGIRHASFSQLNHAQHTIHGCSQFMAHIGKEGALGTGSRFGGEFCF